jgi:hypothetical protein
MPVLQEAPPKETKRLKIKEFMVEHVVTIPSVAEMSEI